MRIAQQSARPLASTPDDDPPGPEPQACSPAAAISQRHMVPADPGRHDRNVAHLNSRPRAASNRIERQLEAAEDHALVQRATAGDAGAFRQLVQRHHRRAMAIAIGLVRDEQDALEIVQEAFLRVHRGMHRFNGGSSFFTWLYRIVTNLSIDLMRKPSRRESELDACRELLDESQIPLLSRFENSDPAEALRRNEIAARIQRAIDALPPYHRGVIVMREIQGLSYEQMAELMGVSKGTIMSRLFHARQKLQRALSDCYEEQFGRHREGS